MLLKKQSLYNPFYKHELFVHLIFWVIYLLFPLVRSISRTDYPYNFKSELIDFIFGVFVFYLGYFLIFNFKKRIYSLVVLLLVFAILAYCNFNLHNALFGGTHVRSFWYYALSYFSTYTILTLFAFALYSLKETNKKNLALEEAIRKKQEAELFGLKAQINPHFLFNTLNTIYSSALKKEDKTAEMILKLSDNFRYLLQEGTKKYVTVDKEIVHIKDYISLQQERLADKLDVNFSFTIDDYNQKIAPLLLIPFIENAFKYVANLKGAVHKIMIVIELNNSKLNFYCSNPYSSTKKIGENELWKKTGIGIKNTKKRLDFLYANNYSLHIDDTNKFYKVRLKINL